jgi:hypothetical protein
MPTAFVAAKSVPSTIMESPGAPDVGVSSAWDAPLTIIDDAAKTDRKSKTKTTHTFLFIQSPPISIPLKLNENHLFMASIFKTYAGIFPMKKPKKSDN